MALDGIVLSKIKDDLVAHLPMRINRITQISANEVLFNVLANFKRTNLLISCHSVYNRLHFTKREYQAISEPNGFIMLLRKHLLNGIIETIEQFEYDRYLKFHIRTLDDLYDTRYFDLYIELMGKYANIILVDENGLILDALKRIPPFENNQRTIWPGAKFSKVPGIKKSDPFLIDTINEEDCLYKTLEGFSPTLEKEVRYRLFDESFKEIMEEIKASKHLFISGNDYHIIPLKHLKKEVQEFELSAGFDYLFYDLEEKERIKSISANIFKFIKRELKHYKTKLNKLLTTLSEADNCDELRLKGDLLYMYERLDQKGLSKIKLKDYEDQDLEISLDAKLNIKENANRYYHLYQKKKRSKLYLSEQIKLCENEIEYFKSVDEQLSLANYEDALLIKEELEKYGYLKKTKAKKKAKTNKWNLYQITYKGHKITFGKNNLQNETLTFKYARSNYLWFHAKDFHGAHLCVDANEVDEDTMRFCAKVAAYYSKGRYSSSVGVNYCLVKDVHKIKGAKGSLVALKNYKTIYIDPDTREPEGLVLI